MEDYQLTAATSGLYAVDAPMRKFWKIVPDRGIEAFPVLGKQLGGDIPELAEKRPPRLPAASIYSKTSSPMTASSLFLPE